MLLNKIVVAEDDDAIAHLISMALGDAGFLCLRARNGEEALRLVRTHVPDLLVLDVMMPNVDGKEVARKLKSDVLLSKTPILMLTALADVEQKVAGFEAGADDYLTKPFDLREFNARVRALIRSARRALDRNPTTHLPGSGAIAEHVEGLLAKGGTAAIAHFFVRGFDKYSELAGFAEADALIESLGKLILERGRDAGDSFVGHLGGVDFIVTCSDDIMEGLVGQVATEFSRSLAAGRELALVAASVPMAGIKSAERVAKRLAEAVRDANKNPDSSYVRWSGQRQ